MRKTLFLLLSTALAIEACGGTPESGQSSTAENHDTEEPQHGGPAQGPAPQIKDLCDHGIEGSYTSQMGVMAVRLQVVCVDQTLVGLFREHETADPNSPPTLNANFSYIAVDDNRLVLSTTPVDTADRLNVASNSAFSYITIDLATLSGDGFSADVMFERSKGAQTQKYKRDSNVKFPTFQPVASNLSETDVIGHYTANHPEFGPLDIEFNIFDHTPFITVAMPSKDMAPHMVFGTAWDPATGLFTEVGVSGDTVVAANPIFVMRGQFTDRNTMSFALFSSLSSSSPAGVTAHRAK
jgi:hypothetical protein